MVFLSFCYSNHFSMYIMKVETCDFLKQIPSRILAFFVASISHLTLWPQFVHLYHRDNPWPPM